ncbi:MAG: hypothetical protein ACE5H9_04465 [Anaerolineae bacterium]
MVDGHPRTTLPFVCNRRNFFKALLKEMVVVIKTVQGGQSFRLAELGRLSDDQLARVIPTMNPDYEIHLEQGGLRARHKQSGQEFKGFMLDEEKQLVFNLFNGQNTLAEIAWQLSQDLGWEKARAFACARELFLALVDHLLCQPGNLLEQDGS